MSGFELLIKQLEARVDLTPTERARLAALRVLQARLDRRVEVGEEALHRRWLEELDDFLTEEQAR